MSQLLWFTPHFTLRMLIGPSRTYWRNPLCFKFEFMEQSVMYCADQNDSESSTYYCYIIDIFWSFAIQIKLYVFIAATIKLFVFYLHIYINEQITHHCWLCHVYFKVSNILYYVSWSYSIYVTKRSIVCKGIIIFLYLRET